MSEIIHKTEPIEHWIVDGKAYRLATQADVGRYVYRSDRSIERAMEMKQEQLASVGVSNELRFVCHGFRWRYAYIQDDLLLQSNGGVDLVEFEVKRTPVPALGDGWYLLTAEDGEFKEGDKITSDSTLALGWLRLSKHPGYSIADWLERPSYAARYFGPAKETEPAAEVESTPITKPIDWTKPVRTKDGRAVRVLCTDGPGEYPVAGYIEGEMNPRSWSLNGQIHKRTPHSQLDLENVPQRIQREYWVNVYPNGSGSLCGTRQRADCLAGSGRLACVKITIDCEEGEGL